MAPRETEDNAYAKFWGDKQRTLWYFRVFFVVVNRSCLQRRLGQRKQIRVTCFNPLSVSVVRYFKPLGFVQGHIV